jgi:adenylate cyclase
MIGFRGDKQVGQRSAMSADFEHALTQEVLRTELVRIKVLIATTSLLAAVLWAIFILEPEADSHIWRGRLRPAYVYVILVPFVLFELWVHAVISRYLKLHRDVPVVRRYFGALIETTMPTVALALHIENMGSVQALGFVVPLAYLSSSFSRRCGLISGFQLSPVLSRRPSCLRWRCSIIPPSTPIPHPIFFTTPHAA